MDAPPPPLAKGGSASAQAQEPEVPQGFEVWCRQTPPVTSESPAPLPAATSMSQQQEALVSGSPSEHPQRASSLSQRVGTPASGASLESPPPASSMA